MAKRAGGSRASRPRAGRAAPPVRKRRASESARYEAIAGEAADEIAANATKGRSSSVEALVQEHIADPNQEPGQDERDRHAEDAEALLAIAVPMLRHSLEQLDEDKKPFVRVVGRIIYILTVDGGRDDCTVTPIAVALLLFLPEHLELEHRQTRTNRQAIDVTEPNLQGLLYDRLRKLSSRKWKSMLQKGATGRGYHLNEEGRFVFSGWPEGIAFDPHDADLWTRRKAVVK